MVERCGHCFLIIFILNQFCCDNLHTSESVKVKVAQSCPTLCNPMDCSLPGSSVHGILQARMWEWVAVPFSKGSSQPSN